MKLPIFRHFRMQIKNEPFPYRFHICPRHARKLSHASILTALSNMLGLAFLQYILDVLHASRLSSLLQHYIECRGPHRRWRSHRHLSIPQPMPRARSHLLRIYIAVPPLLFYARIGQHHVIAWYSVAIISFISFCHFAYLSLPRTKLLVDNTISAIGTMTQKDNGFSCYTYYDFFQHFDYLALPANSYGTLSGSLTCIES